MDRYLSLAQMIAHAYKNSRSRSYFSVSSSIVLPSWSAWKRP